MLTDTHCHLDFQIFDQDRHQILERAAQHKVTRIINPGTNIETSKAALQMASQFPSVSAAVGIHPNEDLDLDKATLRQLRTLSSHPNVVAIGEIGLDYFRNITPPDKQKHRFRIQLDLASELGLPVIVHCRDAYEDTINIISEWQSSMGVKPNSGVFHSFSGLKNHANTIIEKGFYIGVTGSITFNKSDNLRDIVAGLPLTHILIETDAPFLSPQPNRGKRNEPAFVRWVADKIAEIKSVTVNEVASSSTQNAKILFGWNN